MKTQIIQLEPHDDAISVKDKMGWGQTSRILLVWPLRGRILTRRLDLMFLQRHSASLGGQLALVTKDREVRYHAKKLGILVFTNIRKAEKSHWRLPRRIARLSTKKDRRPQPADESPKNIKPHLEELQGIVHPKTPRILHNILFRVIIFLLGVIAVVAIAAVLVPSAEITLIPATTSEEITIPVQASPDNKTTSISGQVPARWLTVIIEGRDFLPTTGSILVPFRTASGEVNLRNVTDDDVTVPANTVVSTLEPEIIRFATTRSVTVPAGSEVSIPIEAIFPGSAGNTSAGTILAIEGPLGLSLTVTNDTPISGGTDSPAAAPNAEDYPVLGNQLLRALHSTAATEIEASLGQDDLLLSNSPIMNQVLEETYEPAESQPADQLELMMRVEYIALVVSAQDLKILSLSVMEANQSDEYQPDPETLVITQLSAPIIQNMEQATWRISASWQVKAQLNEYQAINLAIGLPPEIAIQRLDTNMDLANPARIRLTPYWWPRLPVLPFRIHVAD